MSSNEPLLALKHTNVSRPQIQHAASLQSISASEDYFTVSDFSSESGDDGSQLTVVRYNTPPEHCTTTPLASHEALLAAAHLSTVPEVRQSQEVGASVSFDERTIAPRPVAAVPRRQSAMDSEPLSTTPGVDDTPYIRFAIDQLTRDEEVRGSRKYPPAAHVRDADDYPVERIIPDEGLGYAAQARAEPPPDRPPTRRPPMPHSKSDLQQDVIVPYTPSFKSIQFPPLTFVPAILRPLWLGVFVFLCALMTVGLMVSAISSTKSGLLDYDGLGDSRYFLFQYLPTLLGMLLLVWLHQIATAVQRISPFMALSSDTARARSEGVFLDLYPTQFLLPTFQHFRAGEPLIGVFFITSWCFLFTIPLLGSSFNVRYYGTFADGRWRWVAVEGVVWTVVVIYILLLVSLFFLFLELRRPSGTGLKWDARSLADIVVLLERSNIMTDYSDSEIFSKSSQFHDRLANRSDRLGYWHTSKRPNDIFYGIGEPGAATRKYTVEQGKIREKAPERMFAPGGDVEAARLSGDIRMDMRAEETRRRYLPWFLTDTFVVAWIVMAVILLLAFLIVSFVDRAVLDGFLPRLPAAANSAGFSPSNFLYSFLPTLLALILYLFLQKVDLSLRRLAPFAALSTPGGATAERSILLDYPARLPISITLAAIINRHWRVALVSFSTLVTAITFPVLASGIFWTQFYPSTGTIRVAAHSTAYYALCVFLALYAATLVSLAPRRKSMAMPHESASLAEVISFLYQSQIVTDRAFNRPETKAELVARLMGPVYVDQGFATSLRNMLTPSKRNLVATSKTDEISASFSAMGAGPSGLPRPPPMVRYFPGTLRVGQLGWQEKRVSLSDPASIMYGFGVHYGRDGREHLGVDRVHRGVGRMMHFD